ncbi:MAG TPA: DUF4190 domain-containing protein [Mycobacteriales bacterium]|nr:DUF4190 domain-containing protein [Mycobacteriales bacterium]
MTQPPPDQPGWPPQPPTQPDWQPQQPGWPPQQPGYPPPQYSYPPQPGYPPYPYYGHPQPRTNGMAIASMVLGILWIYWVGSVLALAFGYIAKSQIRERGEGGGGMATAGIVLGWIGVGTLALIGVLVAAASTS